MSEIQQQPIGSTPSSVDEVSDVTRDQGTMGQLIPVPHELLEVKAAIDKLTQNVTNRYKDRNYLTLLMFVDFTTAQALLLPVPGKENLEKYKHRLSELPENIRNIILKSIPQDDKSSVETIWQYMESKDASAIRELTSPKQPVKERAQNEQRPKMLPTKNDKNLSAPQMVEIKEKKRKAE